MNRIFLVDYENVSENGLKGIFDISCEDYVYIFYTDKNNKISFDFLERFVTDGKNHKIKFLKSVSGNNALDFQLASFLGALIEKNGAEEFEYVIVSNDKGFGCLATFWEQEKHEIKINYATTIAKRTIEIDKNEEKDDTQNAKVDNQMLECEIEPLTIVVNTLDNSVKTCTKNKVSNQPKQKNSQKSKQLTPEECTVLNRAVQQALSKANYDAKFIGVVASHIVSTYKEGKGKKEIYTWLSPKYKRDKGLEIYNIVKPVLK